MSYIKVRTSSGQLAEMLVDFMDKLMTVTAVEPVEIKPSSPADNAIADVVIQRLANLHEAEQVPVVAIRLK